MEFLAKALVWICVPVIVICTVLVGYVVIKGGKKEFDEIMKYVAIRDAERCIDNKWAAFWFSPLGFVVIVLGSLLEGWYIYEYAGSIYGHVNVVMSIIGLMMIYKHFRIVDHYRHRIDYYPS